MKKEISLWKQDIINSIIIIPIVQAAKKLAEKKMAQNNYPGFIGLNHLKKPVMSIFFNCHTFPQLWKYKHFAVQVSPVG